MESAVAFIDGLSDTVTDVADRTALYRSGWHRVAPLAPWRQKPWDFPEENVGVPHGKMMRNEIFLGKMWDLTLENDENPDFDQQNSGISYDLRRENVDFTRKHEDLNSENCYLTRQNMGL